MAIDWNMGSFAKKNANSSTTTTIKNPLPRFFKATLKLINYYWCCYYGISSKPYTENGVYTGNRPSISWKEYGVCLQCGSLVCDGTTCVNFTNKKSLQKDIIR